MIYIFDMHLQCVIGTMRKVFCSKLLNSFLILNLLNLERAVSEFLPDNDSIKVEGKEFLFPNHLPPPPSPAL